MEKEKLIQSYIEGYKDKPESIEEIKSIEQLSVEAFEDEGLI